MTETKPEYHTDQDSGDEHPFGPDERTAYPGGGVYTRWTPGDPITYMQRFDAAYWHAQAETAIRALEQAAAERDAALARVELLEDVAVTFMRRDLDTRKLYKRVNKVLRSAHDRLEPMIARLYQDSE